MPDNQAPTVTPALRGPSMTPAQIEAIDRMYFAAKAVRDHAQTDLDLAENLYRVASALHDIAHEPTLRAVL